MVSHRVIKSCMTLVAVFATIMSLFGTRAESTVDVASRIRELPYPFHNVVSFSDDADELKPWHAAAIHRVFNEQLGLQISDSLWPHGSNRLSTLFLGPDRLNRTPSGIDGLPTYALLLREWHRGNFDQFHGWQEDSSFALRNTFDPAVSFVNATIKIAVPPVRKEIADQQRQNFRLYFDSEPPKDLSVTLQDSTGRNLVYGPDDIAKGQQVQVKPDRTRYMVELIIPTEGDLRDELALNLGKLSDIVLSAPSCTSGCETALQRIERDDFSRETVLREEPTLADWNIRPTFLTSHGGNTLAQDFGVDGRFYEVPREPGTVFADPAVIVRREAHATDQRTHAYHSDVLASLGVSGVWSYFPANRADYFSPVVEKANNLQPHLTSTYQGFYNVPRTYLGEFDRSSPEAFADSIRPILPNLSDEDRKSFYCGKNCDTVQGDSLALLVATSIENIKAGNEVRHFWYTHFGSGGSGYHPTIEAPLTPTNMVWMKKLANYVYNFDGKIPESQRVWCPPAGTWVRYQEMMSQIAPHVTIDDAANIIKITPWTDPVTGRLMPDPNAGSRDLHGLTLYVSDPQKTRIFVGDSELFTFTRNPEDNSGHASVTIVDDNSPTTVLDDVALSDKAQIVVEDGDVRDKREDATMQTTGHRILTLTADDSGRAEMRLHPSRLEFWNTDHIALTARKLANGGGRNKATPGHLEISFVMDDGRVVSIEEARADTTSSVAASRWLIAPLTIGDDWRHDTLDVARLTWPTSEAASDLRPPLPLGKIHDIRIALVDATPGTSVEISDLRALRANPNGTSDQNLQLIAGRVTSDGKTGLANIKMRIVSQHLGMMKAETDQDGFYFLPHMMKGDVVSIAARIGGQYCSISQGKRIEVSTNETELDVNAANCQQLISSADDVSGLNLTP